MVEENNTQDQPEQKEDGQELLEFYRHVLPQYTLEEIVRALETEKSELGQEEFDRQVGTYGTQAELLVRMLDSHTDQSLFLKGALNKISSSENVGTMWDHQPVGEADENDKPFTLKNQISSVTKSLKGAEVSGREARLLILANNSNIKRIHLYNSGFNVVLRGPSLVELNLVYNRINDAIGEYGRILGAIFFMYSDFKIKSILWDFIESLVIDSNLDKYNKGNRLRDCVTLHDYSTILLNITSLMYKTGFPFTHVCTNTDCKHKVEETVDLSLLQLNDYGKIPHEKLAFLARAKPVKPGDLRSYVKSLDEHWENEFELSKAVDVGNYRIHRRVPSMTHYMTHGEEFNDELAMQIHDITDENTVNQYLRYNYARLFEPWISYVEVLDEDGGVSFKIVEREAITLILTQIQNSDHREKFAEKMNDYTQRSMITNTGYLTTPCPKCGQEPDNADNGYVVFDVQNSFFNIAIRALIERS